MVSHTAFRCSPDSGHSGSSSEVNTGRLKRVACGATFGTLPFALIMAWVALAPPNAETSAKRFGRSVRATISDDNLVGWAQHVLAVERAGAETEIDIPRSEWPPELIRLLERNQFATVTLCRNRAAVPSGIRLRDGIVGIVIPLNGTIPNTVYFSLTWSLTGARTMLTPSTDRPHPTLWQRQRFNGGAPFRTPTARCVG
jgi:hypothetical protein